MFRTLQQTRQIKGQRDQECLSCSHVCHELLLQQMIILSVRLC